MNIFGRIYKTLALTAVILFGVGCADLDVENLNAPDRERALSEAEDLVALLQGGYITTFNSLMSSWNVHLDIIADQQTTTNAFRSFWDFAEEEPTLRFQNTTTFDDRTVFEEHWNAMNSAVSSANTLITAINTDGIAIVVDDNDITQQTLAAAYFLRGLAQGYLGYVYDKGYVVNEDTDLSALTFATYSELIAAGLSSIDQSISIAQSTSGFEWNFILNAGLDATEFTKLANAYAARIAIGEARTATEAATLDYSMIKNYAQNAITEDFSPISDQTTASGWHSWATFQLSDDAMYLPTDIKVCRLFDPSFPTEYPLDQAVILDPVNTNDARISYFNYTPNFGYLRDTRNRALFSNYGHLRYQFNHQQTIVGNPIVAITAVEMDYIRAEAEWKMGNNAAAKAILDAGPRSTVGGLSSLPNDSDATILHALFYEYAIELDLSGKGIELGFMRRNDLLQPGRALHYPIPATELEITGDTPYNFGGSNYTSEEGTAAGTGWKAHTFIDFN